MLYHETTPNPVAQARKRLGWTQTRLAQELGISMRQVRNLEHGKSTCSRTLELALYWIEQERSNKT